MLRREVLPPVSNGEPEVDFQVAETQTGLHEECGVLAFHQFERTSSSSPQILGEMAIKALKRLQHRGQQSAGIITVGNLGQTKAFVGQGLVSEVFPASRMTVFPYTQTMIGHTRWTTDKSPRSAGAMMPYEIGGNDKKLLISKNGQILAPFNENDIYASDSYATGHQIYDAWTAQQVPDPFAAISSVMSKVQGSYSMVLKFIENGQDDYIYAVRDPWGNKPFVYGMSDHGVVIASETGALEEMEASQLGEVQPGHIFRFDREGNIHKKQFAKAQRKSCIFENVYFSKPGHVDASGTTIGHQRHKAGKYMKTLFSDEELSIMRDPDSGYVIVPLPATSIPAANGLHEATGIAYSEAILRNGHAKRSFINGAQKDIEHALTEKFIFNDDEIRGKKLILVDDSLVRGNTARQVISLLKDPENGFGAAEVHLVLASPEVVEGCNLGVDIQKEDLEAPNKTATEIARDIGADSVRYLSLENLVRSVGQPAENFCKGCFGGEFANDTPVQLINGALQKVRSHQQDGDKPKKSVRVFAST